MLLYTLYITLLFSTTIIVARRAEMNSQDFRTTINIIHVYVQHMKSVCVYVYMCVLVNLVYMTGDYAMVPRRLEKR